MSKIEFYKDFLKWLKKQRKRYETTKYDQTIETLKQAIKQKRDVNEEFCLEREV